MYLFFAITWSCQDQHPLACAHLAYWLIVAVVLKMCARCDTIRLAHRLSECRSCFCQCHVRSIIYEIDHLSNAILHCSGSLCCQGRNFKVKVSQVQVARGKTPQLKFAQYRYIVCIQLVPCIALKLACCQVLVAAFQCHIQFLSGSKIQRMCQMHTRRSFAQALCWLHCRSHHQTSSPSSS